MSNEVSMIGGIIDMPMEEFIEELDRQKVNVGTINNLILHLEAQYNEVRQRKDAVLKLKFKGTLDVDNQVVVDLYAELTKIEQKVIYLKERVKNLLDLGI